VGRCSDMQEDDGYERAWGYRVFSQLNTEPDVPESGRRYLTVRKVWPRNEPRGHLPDYPTPDDIAAIDHVVSVSRVTRSKNSISSLSACGRRSISRH
jgi:hypothetical protein